ncbi:MAG TPA: hypothetical protein VFY39_16685 [Gammaproteobacteria bacterium]|nr:hypothetical protein [Gammaproteobacteria bacterium]
MFSRPASQSVAAALLALAAACFAPGGALAQTPERGTAPRAQQSEDCDRACLREMLDAYLNAVVKHDPSAAPLWTAFRQTENAVVVRRGTGVWSSVTGLGRLQRRYFDPVTGQALYLGTVEEAGGPAIAAVRVRVAGREIREAEWYIARNGAPGMNGPPAAGRRGAPFDVENFVANAPPERVVPSGQRAPRDVLLAVTNSYFDGITTHDGRIIMEQPDCSRVENGIFTAGKHIAPPGGGAPRDTNCGTGLEHMNIQAVVGRRFPLVDEEAQVVLGMAVFIRKPGTMTRRNTFAELFVIDDKKINRVYATMFYPPPEQLVPNWPPYEGHWSLPAQFFAPSPKAGGG